MAPSLDHDIVPVYFLRAYILLLLLFSISDPYTCNIILDLHIVKVPLASYIIVVYSNI